MVKKTQYEVTDGAYKIALPNINDVDDRQRSMPRACNISIHMLTKEIYGCVDGDDEWIYTE